jgi:endonuclease YncB( thermonuclease family)
MLRVAAVSRKRHTRSGLALFLCLLFAGFCATSCSRAEPEPSNAAASPCNIEPAQFTPYRVDTVFDGDTLRLVGGGKVRLIGINTPERGRDGQPAQPLAMEATASLKALIGPERRIFLRDGQDSRDRYGRRLAHVFDHDGNNLAAELLRLGMGFHVAISPNFADVACLQAAETEAAAAGRGVWSETAPEPRAVGDLAPSQGGFIRIRGRVTRVSFKDNGWWVQLDGKVGLQIKTASQHLFQRKALRELQGQTVEARGWLIPMNGDWWMMNIGHPSMLDIGP